MPGAGFVCSPDTAQAPQTQKQDPGTDGFPPGCPGYPASTTALYKGFTPVLGHDSKCPSPCTNPECPGSAGNQACSEHGI